MTDIHNGLPKPVPMEESWIFNAPRDWIHLGPTVDKGPQFDAKKARKLTKVRKEKISRMVQNGEPFYAHRMEQIWAWIENGTDISEIAVVVGTSKRTIEAYARIFEQTHGYFSMLDNDFEKFGSTWMSIARRMSDHLYSA